MPGFTKAELQEIHEWHDCGGKGVYTRPTSGLANVLETYATPVCCVEESAGLWNMPFCRVVIAVQPKNPKEVRISNSNEYIFQPENLTMVEVFILRGQGFESKGTRYCYLTIMRFSHPAARPAMPAR